MNATALKSFKRYLKTPAAHLETEEFCAVSAIDRLQRRVRRITADPYLAETPADLVHTATELLDACQKLQAIEEEKAAR